MKKKVCLLVTLILSLFLFSGKVEAAKELTCVYEGEMEYATMLVQDSDGKLYYFAANNQYDEDITENSLDFIDWKTTSEFSDKEVSFIYNTKNYDEEKGIFTACPKWTSGYVMNETEVEFYDEIKGLSDLGDHGLIEEPSCEGEECSRLPYIVSGESDKQEEIDDIDKAEWSSKCTYCGSDSSCLNLYFNDTDILIDNHRDNIISETVKFTLDDIKNGFGFTCPDVIYESYLDSYAYGGMGSSTFSAEYSLINPKLPLVTYNFPICSEGAGCIVNYLYELELDKEKSEDEFSGTLEDFDSAFTPSDVDNCGDLLGPELIEIINDIMNLVRIIVPILLIVLGILDFTKATFSGSADDMAKVKKTFINRIIAAVIVFLIPIFVNLLLTLANEVWGYINPTSCIK